MRGLWTWTGFLVTALAGWGLTSAFVIGDLWILLQEVQTAPGPSPAAVNTQFQRLAAYSAAKLVLVFACPVLWLVWQSVAARRVHERLGEILRFPPGRSLLWWFVPVASFWRPFDVVQEIYLASIVATEPEVPHTGPDPGAHLLRAWWASGCLAFGLSALWWTAALLGEREFVLAMFLFGELMWTLCAGFAIAVVWRIAAFQGAWPAQAEQPAAA